MGTLPLFNPNSYPFAAASKMKPLILIATWKAWTVPILVVIGIAGFLFRGLVDMAENFETGYGPDSKRASRQAFAILSFFVIAAFLVWILGCSHLTVAPTPVVAHQIAFDENSQTAGVIDCDKNGCLVSPNWMAKYKAMEAELKQPIAADANIKPEGKNFRVSYECNNHYAEMRASERGP